MSDCRCQVYFVIRSICVSITYLLRICVDRYFRIEYSPPSIIPLINSFIIITVNVLRIVFVRVIIRLVDFKLAELTLLRRRLQSKTFSVHVQGT